VRAARPAGRRARGESTHRGRSGTPHQSAPARTRRSQGWRSPTLGQRPPLPGLVIGIGQAPVAKRRDPAAAVAVQARPAGARLTHRRAAPLTDPNRHEPTLADFVTKTGNETSPWP